MKHLLLSLALIISANAWSDNISFSLNCKTSELVTTEVKDGKSDTKILAEEVLFTIDWNQEVFNDKYFNQVSLYVPGEKVEEVRFYFNKNQLMSNQDGTFIFDADYGESSISENKISLTATNAKNTSINLNRYYRNDRSFLLTFFHDSSAYIMTGDCMGMPEEYFDFLDRMK